MFSGSVRLDGPVGRAWTLKTSARSFQPYQKCVAEVRRSLRRVCRSTWASIIYLATRIHLDRLTRGGPGVASARLVSMPRLARGSGTIAYLTEIDRIRTACEVLRIRNSRATTLMQAIAVAHPPTCSSSSTGDFVALHLGTTAATCADAC